MNYDFSTLNDKDFEELIVDLLNAHFKLDLQSFKIGKDKGVDLRYSSIKNNNSIVVQAKHYFKSGYSQLKSSIKSTEVQNAKNLKPERYIFVTSMELSNTQKDEIKHLFKPYIQTSNDVVGREDLNRYLRGNKQIVKNHFKLWFSSTEIISNILNNAIEGRTKSYLSSVKSKVPLYVLTKNFDQGNIILEREKILLITGLPGVGKTTLAEILLFEKGRNDYQIYFIRTIKEAEDVISPDEDTKQVFYFDDFLGEVYYEIIAGSQKESEIAQFVDRIKHTPNKYLILSTRTIILEQAKNKSEKIKNSRIESGKYELCLNDYTKLNKAKILYNHLYFRDLKAELSKGIIQNEFYKKIILHKNYNPRLIEFITDKNKVNLFSKEEYLKFVLDSLEKPEEIWRHSFSNQTNYFDKCLLITMFTFQGSIEESAFNNSFNLRVEFEKNSNNQIITSNIFKSSIRNLMNGFILATITDVDKKIQSFKFINPSLMDYLFLYLNGNNEELKAIVSSAKYIEQIGIFNPEKGKLTLNKELQIIIKDKIDKDQLDTLDEYKQYTITGLKMEVLVKYCTAIDIDDILLHLLKQVNLKQTWWIRRNIYYVLTNLSNLTNSIEYIKDNFFILIKPLLLQIDDRKMLLEMPSLFKKFGKNYSKFATTDTGHLLVSHCISSIVIIEEKELFSSYKDSILDSSDADFHIYDSLNDFERELFDILLPNSNFVIEREYNEESISNLIEINNKNLEESMKRENSTQKYFDEFNHRQELENILIEDMFNSFNN
ncbi:Restriction endonuclease [Flavobacterium fryxellicola]|uniref:Uncharacterized protein n=1 Tax=Flavobacterium fryxellicola TaxID=249352 RepID=A0A167XX74_9FLAO|nr:restriction endonuclease [Flavobacterium fryxellicola]OAB28782.1 hypothetical protein FBFR_04740 [Flavobacterium fryxellicola]SHN61772.1 Restriction endonuclease [Flavobacterium fryxellicola]